MLKNTRASCFFREAQFASTLRHSSHCPATILLYIALYLFPFVFDDHSSKKCYCGFFGKWKKLRCDVSVSWVWHVLLRVQGKRFGTFPCFLLLFWFLNRFRNEFVGKILTWTFSVLFYKLSFLFQVCFNGKIQRLIRHYNPEFTRTFLHMIFARHEY